jgi:DNA-binding transcriptional LysR family regulator
MIMDPKIKAFIEVASSGSFSKAADSLGVSQPAVSKNIRELELLLGLRLFDRNSSCVSMTESGKLFYSHALKIAGDFDSMEKDMELLRAGLSGKLMLFSGSSLMSIVAVPLAASFSGRFKNVEMEIVQGTPEDLAGSVADGNNALGIFYEIETGEKLNNVVFSKEKFVIVCGVFDNAPFPLESKDNLIDPEDLDGVPFVMGHSPSPEALLFEKMFPVSGTRPDISVRLDREDCIKKYIMNRPGCCALLPRMCCAGEISEGFLKEFFVRGLEEQNICFSYAYGSLVPLMEGFIKYAENYRRDSLLL